MKITFSKKTKNNKKILNNAYLSLNKQIINHLGWDIQSNNLIFSYKDKIITLKNGVTEDYRIIENDGKISEIVKNINVIISNSSKKIAIPLGVCYDLELTDDNREVEVFLSKNKEVKIRRMSKLNKDIEPIILDKEEGKVITIKANKGGVGKTFLSCQLASGLSIAGYKILVITSDSQNDVFSNFTKPNSFGEKPLFIKKGLKSWVSKGEGEKIKLRENLYFIPLESAVFSATFLKNLPKFINKQRKEYDFVIIDSVPTMKTDSVFLENSDKIIIPLKCDLKTLQNTANVFSEAGADKILAVVPNLYNGNSTAKHFYKKLLEYCEGTNILLPLPIQDLSKIQHLETRGLTIFESEDKSLINAKKSLNLIIDEIIKFKNGIDIDNHNLNTNLFNTTDFDELESIFQTK